MSGSISKFKQAFGYGAAPEGDSALAADCRAAGAAWPGTSQLIKDQLSQLRNALFAEYRDQGVAEAITGKFDAKIGRFMQMLDGSVGTALNAVAAAKNPAEQAKLGKEARKMLSGYEALVQNKTVVDLDENPFVPLSIRATLSDMLARVPAGLGAG